MVFQRLTRVHHFETDHTRVSERIWKVFRLDMVERVMLGFMEEHATDVALVAIAVYFFHIVLKVQAWWP